MSVVRFDQIARECRETFKGSFEGKPIVGLEHIEPYDMLLKNYDVDVETTFTKSFKKGQILFGRRRAYQHKACVATIDGICSGDITVIEPIEGKVYPDLLPFIIQNDDFFEHAIKGSNGALSPRVKWEHMANFELDLPSLAEQKVLAEKLWAAYEVKQSYLKMIAATEEMVKAQFIEMFDDNKKIEKQGVLADFCALKAGKSVKSGDISDSYEKGLYPCYGGNGLRGYVSSYSHDGIYNIIGRQGALCGNVNIVNGKFYATEHAVVVTPKEQITPYWLYFALSGMKLNQYARGVAQPGLAVNQLERLPFAIPSIDLQQRFVTIAEQADKSISELRKSVDAIDKVIKSLINENL